MRRRRALVVQRTGWGKTAVYLLATRLLRDAGAGPTLLVSPLLALMRNQLLAAERAGVRAATINSSNVSEWKGIEEQVRRGAVDILLVSPERLSNENFRRDVLPHLTRTTGLLVVDEAHCISDWGHDFRPDYRLIARVLERLPPTVPVLCTTATANNRVIADIEGQLGGLQVIRGPLDRPSLSLRVVDLPGQAERLAWLAQTIPGLPGSGIVYCLTVADTGRIAEWLQAQGIDAVAYTGGTDTATRVDVEGRLLDNRTKVVVATSALGMGFDKPDLTFVIHYQSPGSSITYYQQVGRAGRAVAESHGVLLCGREDADIQDYFITTAFPPRAIAEQVVALLEARDEPVGVATIEAAVNVRRSRLETMLKVLEVEGAVERSGGRWSRTLRPWEYDQDRVRQVTAQRRLEQQEMIDYARTAGCRMEFLRACLDDPAPARCGRCDNCMGERTEVHADRALVAAAVEHVRGRGLIVEPRKRWPGGLGWRAGAIAHQLQEGRALSRYGDGGWGSLVSAAKYRDHRYPAELVTAAARLIRDWAPSPAPTWLTWVPSAREPELVASFAGQLGATLGLPVVDCLRRSADRSPQKEMENSAQQVRNVYRAFETVGTVPASPVLLVDDVVDWRWTLTAVGVLLREAGAGEVFPFVLAKAVSR